MAITASTVPLEPLPKDGDIIALPMTSGETIYKGDMVRIVAAGTATSSAAPTAGDAFAGVAMETVTDVGGAMKIRVYTNGVFPFTKAVPAQTDVGCLAYQGAASNQ